WTRGLRKVLLLRGQVERHFLEQGLKTLRGGVSLSRLAGDALQAHDARFLDLGPFSRRRGRRRPGKLAHNGKQREHTKYKTSLHDSPRARSVHTSRQAFNSVIRPR